MLAVTTELEVLHFPPTGGKATGGDATELPPLLFLHGAFAGAWIWAEHYLPWFAAQGWDCYAPSLRGHGNSPGKDRLDFLGVEDYIADALSVLDSLPQKPVVIGHSMGGMVAQRCLARRELPAGVLIASAPPQGLLESTVGLAWRDPFVFREMSKLVGLGRDHVDLEGVRRAMFSDRITLDDLQRWVPLLGDESRRVLMEMTMWNPFPPRPRGKPPILVLGAEKDLLFPPPLVQSTARFFGVEPEFFPDMGHAVMLEPDHEVIARRVDEWLRGVLRF